ncbi:Aspartyl/glutamyl-tRNA(Asn/Gln) amidotransferases ubunit C (Asp/Glu-ADT subunit C) [Aneurinibacillus migulanus]|nr:Aspartyl/glutamyl-tRNA(Asn/Gln) amidotransferases ubunit C (Asp/Glu-ADT subunit C) [Aneurinibacillus migulanus]
MSRRKKARESGGGMMSAISRNEVEYVAKLARLNLTEEEAVKYTEQLNSILEFAGKLNELDTANVPPTSHVLDVYNVMRDDEVRPSVEREDALRNAPDEEDGQFKVPAVME